MFSKKTQDEDPEERRSRNWKKGGHEKRGGRRSERAENQKPKKGEGANERANRASEATGRKEVRVI